MLGFELGITSIPRYGPVKRCKTMYKPQNAALMQPTRCNTAKLLVKPYQTMYTPFLLSELAKPSAYKGSGPRVAVLQGGLPGFRVLGTFHGIVGDTGKTGNPRAKTFKL